MKVTILGSGTAIPSAERFPSGLLVRSPGATLVVDMGPGVLRRLPGTGVGLGDIDAVLLTHFHVDHCSDLPALLFALWHPSFRERKPLALFGGPGFGAFLGGLRTAWPKHLWSSGYELAEHEIGAGSVFTVGDLLVEAVAVSHKPESLAYRIRDADGRLLVVSGDSDVCPGLEEAAQNADLFVCEASTPSNRKRDGHLTARLAAETAAKAGVHQLCLTHFYPDWEGLDPAMEARTAFDGPLVIARDLTELEV